jgi:hypothetical protein
MNNDAFVKSVASRLIEQIRNGTATRLNFRLAVINLGKNIRGFAKMRDARSVRLT